MLVLRNVSHISLICHNSVTTQNVWFFKERLLKILKCHNFLWVQWRYNRFPAASFANRVTTLYLLKVHLRTFLSIPITQKCQILSCDTLVANERYVLFLLGLLSSTLKWLEGSLPKYSVFIGFNFKDTYYTVMCLNRVTFRWITQIKQPARCNN